MKRLFHNPLKSARSAAASTLLLGGVLLSGTPTAVRAADPYDKTLEQRVEALERELNTMSNDSKGKDVTTTEVPTFIRASKNVQELRFRNELSTTDNQVNNTSTPADANRFRFRLFADYKLNDQFFAGAAVQTALASDSGNTTISEGFDNYSLYLWRFFVGWHSKDDSLKFILGKQPNPFYEETEMLWDADISPIGITEQVKFELSLIGGQFAFNDNPENALYNGNGTAAEGAKVPGGDNNADAYLAYQQILGVFKVNNNLSVSGAGGFLFYPGHGDDGNHATHRDQHRDGEPEFRRRRDGPRRGQRPGPSRQRVAKLGRVQLGQRRAQPGHRHVQRRREDGLGQQAQAVWPGRLQLQRRGA